MQKNDLELLFAYNRWANARILSACQDLSPDQLRAPMGASFSSLMGTLVHTLGTEIVWRVRMQESVSPTRMVSEDEFGTLEALAARWREEEAAMQEFLSGLTDGDLNRKVSFTRLKGDNEESTLWKALTHVVLHGMQFRSEAGMLLTRLGHSPGDLDFIFYLRDIGAR